MLWGMQMTFNERDNLMNGNILISYGAGEDHAANDKGYKFLGVSVDVRGNEIHIFEMKPIEDLNKENV